MQATSFFQNALEIKNLSFGYSKELVLENINLTVKERDFLVIIGPNGGGKSTLVKLILGLHMPKSGTITLFGKSSLLKRESIGYVPQNTNINIHFPIKVIEVVMMGSGNNKAKEEAKKALLQVGMWEYCEAKIGSLSGGQRQRVMIARALYTQPKILILDEPTSSIDVDGQKKIYDLLRELNREITVIVVSHDISIILEYASKVAHINKHLSFHDISTISKEFQITSNHICEVELLQMLGAKNG